MAESYRGRFAPSPSGPLHLGNLRTALLAWLLARHAGGAFVLRMEDLDRPRVRPGAASTILSDLRWLGLDWDEGPDVHGPYAPYVQSERSSIYAEHLQILMNSGLVYECYCSRADLLNAASAPQDGSDGPRYPGTCRDPAMRERQRHRAGGRPPALRFRAPDENAAFVDGLYGLTRQNIAQQVGDFVLRRADGVASYQLAVVVDDALMAMTDIVRGADLLASTPRQIVLYRAFGYTIPRFLHVPLALDAAGARMAKRHGSAGVEPHRASGLDAAAVVGMLAASAGLVPYGTRLSAHELLKTFDPMLLTHVPGVIMTG